MLLLLLFLLEFFCVFLYYSKVNETKQHSTPNEICIYTYIPNPEVYLLFSSFFFLPRCFTFLTHSSLSFFFVLINFLFSVYFTKISNFVFFLLLVIFVSFLCSFCNPFFFTLHNFRFFFFFSFVQLLLRLRSHIY